MTSARDIHISAAAILALLLYTSLQGTQQAVEYKDSKGKAMSFPLGDVSFADEVVTFDRGKPSASDVDSVGLNALGSPNYDPKASTNYVALGCGGTLTLRFSDNAVVDVPGPDLYVFEIGPAIEPTELSLSTDGARWVTVGRISGGRAEVDIKDAIPPGGTFHFVRLTDLKSACGGRWPGADIDAVGAIGAGLVISLESAVLFDVDRFAIKPAAEQALQDAAKKINAHVGATILVDGHTDSTGSAEHNLTLSTNRAQAIRDYLVTKAGVSAGRMQIHGYGQSRPIASNDTTEGRERNRRVEIVVIPVAP